MLEEIVKKYVPFGGIYYPQIERDKWRINFPSELIDILKKRQKVRSSLALIMYMRLHKTSSLEYIEFTDYFPQGNTDFENYKPVYIQKHGSVYNKKFEDFGRKGKQIVLVGYGNSILAGKLKYKDAIIEHFRTGHNSLPRRSYPRALGS